MEDYRIVKTMGNLGDLEVAVKAAMKDGWRTSGAPFRSEASREWGQAMLKTVLNGGGELRLREQGRAPRR